MEEESLESSRQNAADQIAERLFHNRRRCCFSFTCSSPSVDLNWWRKIRTARIERRSEYSIWGKSVVVLKKIREWSEIVAGPRWKTFIRRFNRNRKNVNCQYDPLSYAMNFDEGQNGHLDDEYSPNFSSRYAKGSMDLGKDGAAAFV